MRKSGSNGGRPSFSLMGRERLRYDPNWVPSWKLPRKGIFPNVRTPPEPVLNSYVASSVFLSGCIDLYFSVRAGRIMDAVRIHDGARVVIKEVATWKEEIPIALYLSSEASRKDSRNCAVPILDVLLFPDWLLWSCPYFLALTSFRFDA